MERSKDTRQRILQSAQDLIYSRSYADVGVAAICEHAQVKKGSFYHFFPSKRDLTLAVLDEFLVDIKERMLAQAFQPDVPPMQRISRMVEALYGFQKNIADTTGQVLGCPFGNLSVELSTQDEPIRRKVEDVFNQLEGYLKQTLDEAVRDGELDPLDTEATARAMLAYLEGLIMMAKTRNDAELIRQLGAVMGQIRVEHPSDGGISALQ